MNQNECGFEWMHTHKCYKPTYIFHTIHSCHCGASIGREPEKKDELLNATEIVAIEKFAEGANILLSQILTVEGDKQEAVHHIHGLQNMIMSRAALEVLNERTRDREDRNVEGTHSV